MSINRKIIKRYGSIKRFCDEMGLNYGSFRTQLAFRRVYGRGREALIKAGIVKDEEELKEILKDER